MPNVIRYGLIWKNRYFLNKTKTKIKQRVITRSAPIFSPFKPWQVIPFWKGNFKLIQHEKISKWGTIQFLRKSGPKFLKMHCFQWNKKISKNDSIEGDTIHSWLMQRYSKCIRNGNFGPDFLEKCKVPHSNIFSCCVSLNIPF